MIEAAITYAGQHILEHVQRDLDRYKAPDAALAGQLESMATEMQEKGHLGGNSISLIALETGDDPELQAACSAVFTQLETLYIKGSRQPVFRLTVPSHLANLFKPALRAPLFLPQPKTILTCCDRPRIN